MDFIALKGYSLEYGARNLSRTLKKELLEKLAPLSLEAEWEESRYVICDAGTDSLDVSTEPAGAGPSRDSFLEKESGSSSG